MAIEVDVQVQNGKLKIIVGGVPPAKTPTQQQNAAQNQAAAQAAQAVGGPDRAALAEAQLNQQAANQAAPLATNNPSGPATVVIGPIVIDPAALQNASGGSGPTDPNGFGGGGPGGVPNTLVIGPIVVGGSVAAATQKAKGV